jgi:hypothetical protein
MKYGIDNLLVQRRERRLGKLSLPETFDEVYARNMWTQGDTAVWAGRRGLLRGALRRIPPVAIVRLASRHRLLQTSCSESPVATLFVSRCAPLGGATVNRTDHVLQDRTEDVLPTHCAFEWLTNSHLRAKIMMRLC